MAGVPGRADAIRRYRARAALELPLFAPLEAVARQLHLPIDMLALMIETKTRQLAEEERDAS